MTRNTWYIVIALLAAVVVAILFWPRTAVPPVAPATNAPATTAP